MELTDPVSLAMHPKEKSGIVFPPVSSDPDYFFDIKKRYRATIPHYWKVVKEYRYRNNHIKDNKYRMDGEINFLKRELKPFFRDMLTYLRTYRDLTDTEITEKFSNDFPGYLRALGPDLIARTVRNFRDRERRAQLERFVTRIVNGEDQF